MARRVGQFTVYRGYECFRIALDDFPYPFEEDSAFGLLEDLEDAIEEAWPGKLAEYRAAKAATKKE